MKESTQCSKLKYDYLIVGAGFAGAVLAERLANMAGKKVLIIDKRDHIGGNCYDYIDENGIVVQKYGPHIFHTNNKNVFDYLSHFTVWNNYKHKVLAFYKDKYYPIPINRDTINLFYGINLRSEEELKRFLESKKININKITNSEEVVISLFGNELYEAFVKHYTKKQWDRYPNELHKSVLERLPIKYDANPYYFPNDSYQGMPVGGFSKMFEKILDHENIDIKLGTEFLDIKNDVQYRKMIFTGRIDEFFGNKFGKLEYRCIDFSFEIFNEENYQPNSVVNYTAKDTEFSRVTEFKKFYKNICSKTVICKERFNWCGELSYPVITEENSKLLQLYKKEAAKLRDVLFLGRLAQYKYLNMDQVVGEGLRMFDRIK